LLGEPQAKIKASRAIHMADELKFIVAVIVAGCGHIITPF